MKLMTVCTAHSGRGIEITCLRCKRTIQHKVVRGIFIPKIPLEPDGEDMIYLFALCKRCSKIIKDKKTDQPKETWRAWIEDEIKARLLVEKPPRIKAETLGKTSEEFFNMAFGLGHGRRRGEKPCPSCCSNILPMFSEPH